MVTRSREVRLAARPRRTPVPSDFELVQVQLPDPGEGEILVRNAFDSVDPYMHGRMDEAWSYVPPFALGEPVAPRVADGTIGCRETILEGIERAPEAFIGLLADANTGKLHACVGPEP